MPGSRNSPSHSRLAVLGAGAWGTVIASLLARNGHEVVLWAQRQAQAAAIAATGRNDQYLPGTPLGPLVRATGDLAEALAGAPLAFLAVPSRAFRQLGESIRRSGLPAALVNCSKGLEVATFKRLSQVLAESLPSTPLAVLSGPNLAGEIAAGKPAATTVASADAGLAGRVQALLQQPTFRVYTSSDVVGVEVAGAMKNVIALACGVSDGLGLGDNTKATLITRGLAEIVRLGTSLGGRTATFYGLAGVGDLVATCASDSSRNHRAGVSLAHGATLADLEASGMTAEGVPTVEAVHRAGPTHRIDLPISREVHAVVFGGKHPRDAIQRLMTREGKAE